MRRHDVKHDDDLEARDSHLVEDHPEAGDSQDHKTLSEHVGYEARGTRTPEETFEAQSKRSGRDLDPPDDDHHVVGSALPKEQGRRS